MRFFVAVRRTLLLFVVAIWSCVEGISPSAAHAQSDGFRASNLPIVVLNTSGRAIPDEPKLTAHMGIIDNGPGARNHLDDPFNGYDGSIGIEIRGSSSQMFPKKQYALETRRPDGSNLSISLLDLPPENDWILHAPYSDKSLLRNVLAYHIGRSTGRYASRTRFCEVVLNGEYQGVYVLMEKIKRDKNRVDITPLRPGDVAGDALTGGYVIKIDKTTGSETGGWRSRHIPPGNPGSRILYQYHHPSPSQLAHEQKLYIRDFITSFEDMMSGEDFADPETGYASWIDVGSFVDFFIANEVGRNVDGYRLSSFMYKDRDSAGGKLRMGPLWDFNLAFGNADYYNGSDTRGLQLHMNAPQDGSQIPFWWFRLYEDAAFSDSLTRRWETLRRGPLHTDSLLAFLDEQVALLDEAQVRNFERWPILGQYVWPNQFVGQTYSEEVDYLKRWVPRRLEWLDEHLGTRTDRGRPSGSNSRSVNLSPPFPNPSTSIFEVTLSAVEPQQVTLAVFDLLGRERRVLYTGEVTTSVTLTLDVGSLPAGSYVVRALGSGGSAARPLMIVP